jgi:hypothetical protein
LKKSPEKRISEKNALDEKLLPLTTQRGKINSQVNLCLKIDD